jgi:hypothetical protein
MVALIAVGAFIIALLGLPCGIASAEAYGALPGRSWETCSPPCDSLPGRCGNPVRPRSDCNPEAVPDNSRPQLPKTCRADRLLCWPSLPEWWTRDVLLRFALIAFAVIALPTLLFFLLRGALFRRRLGPAGLSRGIAPAPAPPLPLPPSPLPPPPPRVNWSPPWSSSRGGVLFILHSIATVLGIAVAVLTVCQSLGYCTSNDVVQRMPERLIAILRWLSWL